MFYVRVFRSLHKVSYNLKSYQPQSRMCKISSTTWWRSTTLCYLVPHECCLISPMCSARTYLETSSTNKRQELEYITDIWTRRRGSYLNKFREQKVDFRDQRHIRKVDYMLDHPPFFDLLLTIFTSWIGLEVRLEARETSNRQEIASRLGLVHIVWEWREAPCLPVS